MCVGRVMQEQLPRLINRRIASYATVYVTPEMIKKTSKMLKYLRLSTYDRLRFKYVYYQTHEIHNIKGLWNE